MMRSVCLFVTAVPLLVLVLFTQAGVSQSINVERDLSQFLLKLIPTKESLRKLGVPEQVDCDVCRDTVTTMRFLVAQNETQDKFIDYCIDLCIKHKVVADDVCRGIVPEFRGEVMTVLHDKFLDPNFVCPALGLCPDNGSSHIYSPTSFSFKFPTPKPPVIPKTGRPLGASTIRIAQVSDIHFDGWYSVGSNPDCGRPLCCRAAYGQGNAGKWGDYHCDTNELLLDSTLESISKLDPPITHLFWTGDNPPHDVWEESRAGQLNASVYLSSRLQYYLPNVTVLPAVGNHESFPVNSFEPNGATSWLYDGLASAWESWIQDEQAITTLRMGGFFTTELVKGLRVISVNMNACNNGNYWLLLNDTDPDGQLQWLIDTLQSAETAGEKVMIIGHIPPGSVDCLMTWSTQFYHIIDRYENSITALFMGHTHRDHFEVVYDAATGKRPSNIVYICPSVTPFTNHNPSYRIYDVDSVSFEVLDHSTYHIDLKQANIQDQADWTLEYTASSAYNMSLTPTDWSNLVSRMESDQTVFDLYYSYRSSEYNSSPCVDTCRTNELCKLKSVSMALLLDCHGGIWDTSAAVSLLEDRLSQC